VECIKVAGKMSFTLGNAFKYLYRCSGKGNPLQDLKKAAFYLEYELNKRRKLWFQFQTDDYVPAVDGDIHIRKILAEEFRYYGWMANSLSFIYKANRYKRSVKSVELALFGVWQMIRTYETDRI
jgi:hypothetical protein